MSQKSSRYERSFAGLVGAMIVTVAAVAAFLLYRGLFNGDVSQDVPEVDWRESVQLAGSVDMKVVHPANLPEGWKATSVDLVAAGERRWGMGMLTDEGKFVGLRQLDESPSEMVETYIDEDAVQGKDVTIDSAVASTWQTWSDEGGDHGYLVEYGDDEVLLVYGSAPTEDIEAFIAQLRD